MAVPVLKLNLAPPPTLWRQHHQLLGWVCLARWFPGPGSGLRLLLPGLPGSDPGRTGCGQQHRGSPGRWSASSRPSRPASRAWMWRRSCRSGGWRSGSSASGACPGPGSPRSWNAVMVQDVRLKSLQRTRNAAQSVELKIRGEAKSRAAEEAFVAALQKNPFFTQVILERESGSPGRRRGVRIHPAGLRDAAAPIEPLPKYGPVPERCPLPAPGPAGRRPSPGPARYLPPPAPAPAMPHAACNPGLPVRFPGAAHPAASGPRRLPGLPNDTPRFPRDRREERP